MPRKHLFYLFSSQPSLKHLSNTTCISACLYAQTLVHQIGSGKYEGIPRAPATNRCKCTLVDEILTFVSLDLGLAQGLVFSRQAMRKSALDHLIDELLVMLWLAKCIFGVALWQLAPPSKDKNLGRGVLL